MKKLAFFIGFYALFVTNVFALNSTQIENLIYAKKAGETINYSETLQAIAWQETRAGDTLLVGNSGELGVFQIKYETAYYVLKKNNLHNIFSKDELTYNLIFNTQFSSIIAKEYFDYLINKFKGEKAYWSKAVLAYNFGPSNVMKYGLTIDPNNYVKKIRNHIQKLREGTLGEY